MKKPHAIRVTQGSRMFSVDISPHLLGLPGVLPSWRVSGQASEGTDRVFSGNLSVAARWASRWSAAVGLLRAEACRSSWPALRVDLPRDTDGNRGTQTQT